LLLEFGFKNYFSFREGATVSLKLDSNCPKEVTRGDTYTPVLCVKGGNGSGKTQLLKAISFVSSFGSRSFASDPDGLIPLESFFYCKEPSEFFVEFIFGGIVYQYEIIVSENEVISETFYRTVSKRTKIVERIGNTIVKAPKSLNELKKIKLRRNASLISTANQYELTLHELGAFSHFFKSFYTNVGYAGLLDQKTNTMESMAKFLYENPAHMEFVKQTIAECDLGISGMRVQRDVGSDNSESFYVYFEHLVDGQLKSVLGAAESSGTKALFKTLAFHYIALQYGGNIVIDELDINLHPDLLFKLTRLYLDEKINVGKARLIFSTHNTEILDELGRYRTYLVNKRENESFAYRLDEIPGDVLRNDRLITPAYRSGKIGGVHRL
jgi:AAA15 family ATPase/GTPase